MDKQRHPLALRRALLAGAVASAVAWAQTAGAQTPPDAPAQPFSGSPAGESVPAGTLEPTPEAAAPAPDRAARLDALFAELAEVDEGAHRRVERQIRRIWSQSGSDTADLLLSRGRAALEQENFVRAIHHLTALTEIAPDFAEAWNMRATAFYARGDIGQALVDIEEALALEPRHFGALTGLGLILEQIGREADALTAYRAARAVNPHLPNVDEAVDRLAPTVDGRDI